MARNGIKSTADLAARIARAKVKHNAPDAKDWVAKVKKHHGREVEK